MNSPTDQPRRIGNLITFESKIAPVEKLQGGEDTLKKFMEEKLPKRALFLALKYADKRKLTYYNYGVFAERSLPLTSLPAPPENAFLLYARPPMWLQICGETIIVTRGMFWCRETRLREYEDEYVTIQKNATEWLIRINGFELVPYGSILHLYPEINGIYEATHGELYAINHDPPEDATSIYPDGRAILHRGNEYVEYDTIHNRELTKVHERELKFVKITGEKTLYVPAYYIWEVLPWK